MFLCKSVCCRDLDYILKGCSMLLRLRQLTAHVLMLQFVMRDLLELEDIERIREVVKATGANGKCGNEEAIIAIRKQLDIMATEEKRRTANKKSQQQRNAPAEEDAVSVHGDEAEGADDDGEIHIEGSQRDNRMSSGNGFGKDYDFSPYLRSLTQGDSWEKVKKQAKCSNCGHPPRNPFITSCKHLYCQECYTEMIGTAAEVGQEKVTCKQCGQVFSHAHPCEPDTDEDQCTGPETRSKKKKNKGKDRRPGREEINDDWLSLGATGKILPSAKTTAIKVSCNLDVFIYARHCLLTLDPSRRY